jgi:hypothetical protein
MKARMLNRDQADLKINPPPARRGLCRHDMCGFVHQTRVPAKENLKRFQDPLNPAVALNYQRR